MMQDSSLQDIRDWLDPVPLDEPSGIPWLVIVAALLVAALAVLAAIWIARHRAARGSAASPEQNALRRLAQLTVDDTKAFYFELTAILVEYLDSQFPIGLTFCTSAEILARLRSIEMMTPECEGALHELLGECDRAKFALEMDDADPAGAARRCRRVIELFAVLIASARRIERPTALEAHVAV